MGWGTCPGIIDHLDYLGPDGLGVDAIWLSPIYPSPGLDLGYDVADHEHVDPLFGTEARLRPPGRGSAPPWHPGRSSTSS